MDTSEKKFFLWVAQADFLGAPVSFRPAREKIRRRG